MARDPAKPLSVLATNLKTLIGEGSVNSWAKAHKLSQTTIRRIVVGEMSPTVEMVEQIAAALNGIMAWQLLVPGFNPNSPPVLRQASAAENDLYVRLQGAIDQLAELRENMTRPGTL